MTISSDSTSKQERLLVLNDENLRKTAAEWVRVNAFKKGEPNMTALNFCEYVNSTLLPSQHLPPHFPRSISLRTAVRWLHLLGFKPVSHKNGIYIDGHEREDVVKYRREYLKFMEAYESDHMPRPRCSDEEPLTPPTTQTTEQNDRKLVLIYHDESIFNVNEAQTWMWGTADKPAILPKTKGSGIMVSDFIDEHNGFLRLSLDELEDARTSNLNFLEQAKELFEYGAARDGYWTGTKFMKQMENAVKIAEFKYTPAMHTLVWLFDQSSCHRAYAPDALNSNNMNVKPGGSQAVMRDTVWAGKVQRLVFDDGVPKGMKQVLESSGAAAQGTLTLGQPHPRSLSTGSMASTGGGSGMGPADEHIVMDTFTDALLLHHNTPPPRPKPRKVSF